MILTVALNLAIDRSVMVPNLALGRRHRSVDSTMVAGGKGVNVARALSRLGSPVIATGFVGGLNGEQVVSQLERERIMTDFTPIADETRFNLAIVEPATGEQTEVNERGPMITPDEAEAFVERLDYLAGGASICVLAGSLPPGLDEDFYARLVGILKRREVEVVLDADGGPMAEGMRAGPSVITPNRVEAEELVGREFETVDEVAGAIPELVASGPARAIITLPDGCVAGLDGPDGEVLVRASIESLEARSRGGAGDAFVAGYVAGRHRGLDPKGCLALGVACGAESTQHFGAGIVDPHEAERLASEVELEEVGSAASTI